MLTLSFILYVSIGGIVGERLAIEYKSPEAMGITTAQCVALLELYDIEQVQILEPTEEGLEPFLFCEVSP